MIVIVLFNHKIQSFHLYCDLCQFPNKQFLCTLYKVIHLVPMLTELEGLEKHFSHIIRKALLSLKQGVNTSFNNFLRRILPINRLSFPTALHFNHLIYKLKLNPITILLISSLHLLLHWFNLVIHSVAKNTRKCTRKAHKKALLLANYNYVPGSLWSPPIHFSTNSGIVTLRLLCE